MFITSLILIFITLLTLHKFLSFFSTYIKYFGYSLNKSTKGVALFNYKGKVFYSNKNIIEYLKLNIKIGKGDDFSNIFSNRIDIKSSFEDSLRTKQKVKNELHISTADYQFEGSITVIPFTSFLGFTYAYLMEISDFTEPLLTDRGKVWGATIQRIAHEIKTPLSTMILTLDNLKNRLKGMDGNIKEELIMMQNELSRIKELTKSFLLYINLEKQSIETVSLSEVLTAALNKFSSYFNSELSLLLKCNNFNVEADYTQLTQLFSLIIENGIDACGGKGEITISAEIDNRKAEFEMDIVANQKKVKIFNDKKYVKISISDNGQGIPEDIIQKIFEPYFTTKKDGTGMGLSLAKKIIEDNNGKLEIKSRLGDGTTVVIYLLLTN